MKLNIPPPMKKVLIACGYDNCYTIGTIDEADINYFTDEIRKGKVSNLFDNEKQTLENFEFNRGQKKLFIAIANIVKKTLEEDGIDGFSLKSPKRKLDLNQRTTCVARKRIKNPTTDPVSVNVEDEDPVRAHQSNLLRLIVKQLITETGELFCEVNIFTL